MLERAYYEFQDPAYERLASISVGHLYRLRGRPAYREHHLVYQPTRPVQVSIGERRKPRPNGQPGYLRLEQRERALEMPGHGR